MNIYLTVVLVGFLLIAIGVTGHLKSVVIEKHFEQTRFSTVDMKGNLINTHIGSDFFKKYKIVKKRGDK